MEEALLLAIALNLILLAIAYFTRIRQVIIVSSIVWVLIGFSLFQEYDDTLLLAIIYLIAFAQIFIPLEKGATR